MQYLGEHAGGIQRLGQGGHALKPAGLARSPLQPLGLQQGQSSAWDVARSPARKDGQPQPCSGCVGTSGPCCCPHPSGTHKQPLNSVKGRAPDRAARPAGSRIAADVRAARQRMKLQAAAKHRRLASALNQGRGLEGEPVHEASPRSAEHSYATDPTPIDIADRLLTSPWMADFIPAPQPPPLHEDLPSIPHQPCEPSAPSLSLSDPSDGTVSGCSSPCKAQEGAEPSLSPLDPSDDSISGAIASP
ncbi:hypothetical protein WJX84_009630, partial [Apatococcus fuscideae]